jgi:hypothetical protein
MRFYKTNTHKIVSATGHKIWASDIYKYNESPININMYYPDDFSYCIVLESTDIELDKKCYSKELTRDECVEELNVLEIVLDI